MKKIRVLWVDDEWIINSAGTPSNRQFDGWEAQWRQKLASVAIELEVTRSASPEVLDKVVSQRFDALVLDHGFEGGTYNDAVELLDVMRDIARASEVPVVILSKLRRGALDHLAHPQLQGVFVKDAEGVEALGSFLETLARPRTLNLLLLSDVHIGFLPQAALADGTLHHDRFFRSLTDRVARIARESKVDAVVVAGDFAWHTPARDLERAAVTVDQIVRAAGVSPLSGLLFCPGNHDLCYDHSDAGDWSEFRAFVERLGIGSGDIFFRRFVNAWNPTTKRLGTFHSQNSVLSVVVNHAARFVFVGLNSCRPTGKKYECRGVIDGDQWDDVGRCLENVPADYIRIAALHHPIFSPPDGFWKPDYPMVNQGSALRYLTKYQFSMVVHGHTHFAGVHAHHVRALNRPGVKHNSAALAKPTLLSVSCPSVLAEPDPNTPNRQFFLARLEQRSGRTEKWDFSLKSYVFEPSACQWEDGEEMAPGEITLGRLQPLAATLGVRS